LDDMKFEVIEISDQQRLKETSEFVDNGITGLQAYLFDLDNMQGFPPLPKNIDKLRAPIIYVCVNPYKKNKGKSWSEIQGQFAVIQASKDQDLIKFKKPIQRKDLFGKEHKVDFSVKDNPPWEIMKKMSSKHVPLDEKIQAVGCDPFKMTSVIVSNNFTSKNNFQKMSECADILANIDLNVARKNETGYGKLDEYNLCSLLQCVSVMGVTPSTRLSYKVVRDRQIPLSPTSEQMTLYSAERYSCLKEKKEAKSLSKGVKRRKKGNRKRTGRPTKFTCFSRNTFFNK